ncbi:MAG: hypothetical protein ACD_3C00006G0013 [uncultured bacterium (gcode 4)]|uniref:Uncharacterized protein n=1 Tax=uncultured bacterium (gcode 4) TaxID=1234023 RepID=K2FCM1_9BACT|nr:MAG: hypothetical protein ACD_3C00006G0013 [uncultured bacterium (gcode 4)]
MKTISHKVLLSIFSVLWLVIIISWCIDLYSNYKSAKNSNIINAEVIWNEKLYRTYRRKLETYYPIVKYECEWSSKQQTLYSGKLNSVEKYKTWSIIKLHCLKSWNSISVNYEIEYKTWYFLIFIWVSLLLFLSIFVHKEFKK